MVALLLFSGLIPSLIRRDVMGLRASGTSLEIAEAISELRPPRKTALMWLRDSGVAVAHGLTSNALFQALMSL